MDLNVKKELIDEINQVAIKNEPSEVEGCCSSSNSFFECPIYAIKMAYNASAASLEIDYNVRVSANLTGVRVYNDNFSHIYAHGMYPRFFSARHERYSTKLTIQNLNRPTLVIQGNDIDPEVYNLVLTFKNHAHLRRLQNDLEALGYYDMSS
ncbi:hypothetical protein M3Y97_01011400 [Aphelenchoides bicaudatus]|nr:hypothetical protein M3Y97_01011400 [Aphelenchoides bicaudatus]